MDNTCNKCATTLPGDYAVDHAAGCFWQTRFGEICLPGYSLVIGITLQDIGGGNYAVLAQLSYISNAAHVNFYKTYASLPDCRNFANEAIPYLSATDTGCIFTGTNLLLTAQ